MQYTSVILLGFLNAFALAAPLTNNQIRSPVPIEAVAQGFDPGVSTAAESISKSNAAIQDHFGKRFTPRDVAADTEKANGVEFGEAGVEADEADVEADEAAVAAGDYYRR